MKLTLAKVSDYMDSNKCVPTNAFIKSQSSYCPLVWMLMVTHQGQAVFVTDSYF